MTKIDIQIEMYFSLKETLNKLKQEEDNLTKIVIVKHSPTILK